MKVTITFETDNASFQDDFKGQVRALMRQAEAKIFLQRRRPKSLCVAPESIDKLLDYNGNTVGKVVVEQ